MCDWDKQTRKNVVHGGGLFMRTTVGPCSVTPGTSSKPEFLKGGAAANGKPSAMTAPSGGTGTSPGAAQRGSDTSATGGTEPSSPPRGTGASPSNSSANGSGSTNSSATGRQGEGCVAVEHLDGYILQHGTHLLRPVLCSRGFCATPNHGIIVDGVYTSMKKLCSDGSWQCIRQSKLVNNLKVAANRRAVVSDSIVVTPYDVRFPKAAIWSVQMLEDVWNLISSSFAIGTAAAVVFFILPLVSG